MTRFRKCLSVVPTCHVVFPGPACKGKHMAHTRPKLCTKVKNVNIEAVLYRRTAEYHGFSGFKPPTWPLSARFSLYLHFKQKNNDLS